VTAEFYYEPWDQACRTDQWQTYHRLLEEAPVYRAPSGTWVVSRYDDVRAMLAMHDTLSSRPQQEEVFAFPPNVDLLTNEEVEQLFGAMANLPLDLFELAEAQVIVGADNPLHKRMRDIVQRGFTRRRLLELEATMTEVAQGCVARMAGGPVDVVETLADPLPVRMISDMLSLDASRAPDVIRWSDDLATLPQAPDRGTAPNILALLKMVQEFSELFVPMIDERREVPRDDLISDLVRATEADALTSTEAALFLLVLMVGGNETSANLISATIACLMQNPDQLKLVLDDDALVPGAVEEALRLESPLQFGFRRALEPVEVQGMTIPQGDLVCLLWGAANRDPRRFENPDRFDATRTLSNLGFGHGAHLCLGAHLSRMEGAAALRAIAPRLPDYDLDPASLRLRPSMLSHGFERVALTPR
jgi:cytochrome P450